MRRSLLCFENFSSLTLSHVLWTVKFLCFFFCLSSDIGGVVSSGLIWLVSDFVFWQLGVCFIEKCYEPLHLKHYDIGESWGRIYQRSVELCTCLGGEVICKRARYTGTTYWNYITDTWSPGAMALSFWTLFFLFVCVCVVCLRNHCENDGVCRIIEATGEEVCGCKSGYIGKYCNISEYTHTHTHTENINFEAVYFWRCF